VEPVAAKSHSGSLTDSPEALCILEAVLAEEDSVADRQHEDLADVTGGRTNDEANKAAAIPPA